MKLARICVIATALIGVAGPVSADQNATDSAKRDVATLLFGLPQWGKAPAGDTLTYSYDKKTTKAEFGPSFSDHIVLKAEKGDDAQSRVSEVKMFSGMNTRPAGPFQSDQQNPILLLVMEENVQELSKILSANPRYLKNAIRKAWRDQAKIEDVSVTVDGKSMPGTRITVAPFANDPQKDRMHGLDGLTYVVEIADGVPGNIATIDIHAPETGAPIFSEVLHFQKDQTSPTAQSSQK